MRVTLRTTLAFAGLSALALQAPRAQVVENQLFRDDKNGVALSVPRGWRASTQPIYPGVALWMSRSQPAATLFVSIEPTTQALVCSWPKPCRAPGNSLAATYACAVRDTVQRMRSQATASGRGGREASDAGFDAQWLEYQNGQRFVRHAIFMNSQRAVSIVLATTSFDARATHTRTFEQMLRTVRTFTPTENVATPTAPNSAVPTAGGTRDATPPNTSTGNTAAAPPQLTAATSAPTSAPTTTSTTDAATEASAVATLLSAPCTHPGASQR